MKGYLVMQKLADLMAVGYAVTNQSDFNVWVSYSGHVNCVSVRVSPKSDRDMWLFDEFIFIDLHETGHFVAKVDEWTRKLNEYICEEKAVI